MKAYQVRTQQAFQYFGPPGKQPEHFIGWERDMQKKTNGYIRQPLSQECWQQHQVIIMNPYFVSGLIGVYNYISKFFIDRLIYLPVFGVINSILCKVMKEWS